MKTLFVALLFLSLATLAGITDGQFEVQHSESGITVTPKKNFHLNQEAPASIQFDVESASAQPEIKKENLFLFKNKKSAKMAKLQFYVCDDKKTVCEKQEPVINFVENKNQPITNNEIKSEFNRIDELNLKSLDGRPTLIVFSAPWCPPCLRMITETYNQTSVKKQLKKVNFIKLNTDLPSNTALADQFNVKAIPTIVLLDKNGLEAHRWLDFQEATNFAKSLQKQVTEITQASRLVELAQLGDAQSAARLGMRAWSALEYAEAIKWLSMTKTENELKFKLAAEVGLAESKKEDGEKETREYLQILQKSIVLTTSELDKLRWTLDYLNQKKELKEFSNESKINTEATIKEIENLLKKNKAQQKQVFANSTYGDYSGFEKAELLWLKTKALKVIDNKELVQKANQENLAYLSQIKLSVKRTGEMLMGISYLREAGEITKVKALYEQLIKAYPQTYVYYEKYARFAQKHKELSQAEELANKALQYSEGNLPQLNLLKSQILLDLNKKAEALSVVETALKLENIESKKYSRTLKKLQELKVQLTSIK